MGRSEKSGLFCWVLGVGALGCGSVGSRARILLACRSLLIDFYPELKHYSAHENVPGNSRRIDCVLIQYQTALFRGQTVDRNPQPAFSADDEWR